jgi:phage shock protein E
VLGSDLTQPVIVYCASGNRSARALAALQEAGYQRVVDGGGVLSLAALLEVELER